MTAVAAEPSLRAAKVVVCVDSDPMHQGKTLAGRPILAPADLPEFVSASVPIVIGSLVNVHSIDSSIRSHVISNPIVRLDGREST